MKHCEKCQEPLYVDNYVSHRQQCMTLDERLATLDESSAKFVVRDDKLVKEDTGLCAIPECRGHRYIAPNSESSYCKPHQYEQVRKSKVNVRIQEYKFVDTWDAQQRDEAPWCKRHQVKHWCSRTLASYRAARESQ